MSGPRSKKGAAGRMGKSGERKIFQGHSGPHHQVSTSTFLSSADGSSADIGDSGLYSRLLADPSGAGGSSGSHFGAGDSKSSARIPATIMFPANKPSSRADAAILDQWISEALRAFAMHMGQSKEDLSEAVEELVPILSIGLHEIVRQVTHHCVERGVVLEKIWRTYVELFDRVLKEMKASLRLHKARTMRVQEDLDLAKTELEDLRRKHPQQMEKLTHTLDGKFAQKQTELEDQLKYRESENLALSHHLVEERADLRSWFPLFDRYSESVYKGALANLSAQAQAQGQQTKSASPELAIASDFKRIMSVLPEEKRKQIGFFICSLLGLRGGKGDRERETAMQLLLERKAENERTIARLEETLGEIKGRLGIPIG